MYWGKLQIEINQTVYLLIGKHCTMKLVLNETL